MAKKTNSDLSKRIIIQRATQAQDTSGNLITSYTDGPTVWAHIEPYQSKIISGQSWQVHEVLYRITMRYRELDVLDRVTYLGRTFEQVIPPIDVDMNHELLQLTCREVIAHG